MGSDPTAAEQAWQRQLPFEKAAMFILSSSFPLQFDLAGDVSLFCE